MKLKLSLPELALQSHSRTLSLKMASHLTRSISKMHPSGFDTNSASQVLQDLDDVRDFLDKQIHITGQAVKAVRGYPHEYHDAQLVKQCEALFSEVNLASEIDSGCELPSLDDTAMILSELQSALEHEKATLNKKRSAISKKLKLGYVKSLVAKSDYSFLNDVDFKNHIPKGAIDSRLFKCEFGKATLDPHDEIGSPNRNASTLKTALKSFLEMEAVASAKRSAEQRNRTRKDKMDDIEKSLQAKLEAK